MSKYEAAWLSLLMGFGAAFMVLAACGLLGSCGATYKDTAEVKTNWIGLVAEVDGGKTTKTVPGGEVVGSILDTLWSFAWLIGLCLLLLVVAAWRFPALRSFLTAKGLRQKLHPKAQ